MSDPFGKLVVTFISIIARREITFEDATSVGLLFSEGHCFWHLLTPVKFYHYFWRVSTFGGLLLWELYGILILSISNREMLHYISTRISNHYKISKVGNDNFL